MPKWSNAEQGSAVWLKERLGSLTASRMVDAMAYLKGGKEAEARRKYKIELIAERMSDTLIERFVTAAMQWGSDTEKLAKDKYEIITGDFITNCGFALHDEIEFCGASPDGLIGHDGLIEIKCPNTTTHLEWLLDGIVPEKHRPQMLLQMLVTGRKWCDFMSYDPRLPDPTSTFIRRFVPTDEELSLVEAEARKFLAEVEDLWEKVLDAES